MSDMTISTLMSVLLPHVSPTLRDATTLPSRSIGRFKNTERKPINAKGYRFHIQTQTNATHGGIADGDNLLAGGTDVYIELCVGSVNSNGSRSWDGGALRNMKDPKYTGKTMAQQMIRDADNHANEHNMNFCYGGVLYLRGVVSGTPTYDSGTGLSTITCESAAGSYYIKPKGKYMFHANTTPFAAHGGAVAFECYDKPSKTTFRVTGDVTASTTVGTGDYIVPLGALPATSSINKGIRGPEYFAGSSGDYFGANRDVEDRIRSTRFDASGDRISGPMLEYVDTLYKFQWPEEMNGTKGHTDFFSFTQRAEMLFNAYPARRLNTQDFKNYDPKADFAGWGGREYVEDPHYPDSTWYELLVGSVYHYEQVPWDVWDWDGQQSRTVYQNGSIVDKVQVHYWATDQYGTEEPGKQVQIYNLSTAGQAVKTTA